MTTFTSIDWEDLVIQMDHDTFNLGPGNRDGYSPFRFSGGKNKHTKYTRNYQPRYVLSTEARNMVADLAVDSGHLPSDHAPGEKAPPHCGGTWDPDQLWVSTDPWCGN